MGILDEEKDLNKKETTPTPERKAPDINRLEGFLGSKEKELSASNERIKDEKDDVFKDNKNILRALNSLKNKIDLIKGKRQEMSDMGEIKPLGAGSTSEDYDKIRRYKSRELSIQLLERTIDKPDILEINIDNLRTLLSPEEIEVMVPAETGIANYLGAQGGVSRKTDRGWRILSQEDISEKGIVCNDRQSAIEKSGKVLVIDNDRDIWSLPINKDRLKLKIEEAEKVDGRIIKELLQGAEKWQRPGRMVDNVMGPQEKAEMSDQERLTSLRDQLKYWKSMDNNLVYSESEYPNAKQLNEDYKKRLDRKAGEVERIQKEINLIGVREAKIAEKNEKGDSNIDRAKDKLISAKAEIKYDINIAGSSDRGRPNDVSGSLEDKVIRAKKNLLQAGGKRTLIDLTLDNPDLQKAIKRVENKENGHRSFKDAMEDLATLTDALNDLKESITMIGTVKTSAGDGEMDAEYLNKVIDALAEERGLIKDNGHDINVRPGLITSTLGLKARITPLVEAYAKNLRDIRQYEALRNR